MIRLASSVVSFLTFHYWLALCPHVEFRHLKTFFVCIIIMYSALERFYTDVLYKFTLMLTLQVVESL